jgi:hypothetical protein
MLPKFAPVKQELTSESITDIPTHVTAQLQQSPMLDPIQSGQRIAISVGSRGIGCIQPVVAAVVEAIRERGAEPFLVPAMGSHGGGTAEGQREVLEGYGLGSKTMGAPIESDMEAIQIGETRDGMPVYFDRNAAAADGILVVNRIKPHTSFRAQWESGLLKMLAVGLGKRQGAATYHAWGIADAFATAATVIRAEMPVLGGVGIVENGHHQPAIIEALTTDELASREPELLAEAWRHFPLIPIEPLDLLVLREIGKDISGTGMDLNVVGMWRRSGGAISPDYKRLAVLDLTPNSHGNGIGVGYADLIPQRLRDKIDWDATYMNCLTSANFNGAKTPITMADDRAVLETGLAGFDGPKARVVIARNTLDLETLWVSEAALVDVEAAPGLAQAGPITEVTFDEDGVLQLHEPDAGSS